MSGGRRSLSLRARVLLGLAVVALILVVVSAVVTATTRSELVGRVDERLRSIEIPTRFVRGDRGAPVGDGGPDRRTGPTGDDGPAGDDRVTPGDGALGARPEAERSVDRLGDVYIGFLGWDDVLEPRLEPSTTRDFSPPSIDVESLRGPRVQIFTTSGTETPTTLRVLARETDQGYVVTAVSLDGVRDTMRRLMLLQLAGSGTILLALGVLAWWVIRLGVRPIKEVTATAAQIADGDLSVRVPESPAGTESGELSRALNRMLGTISGAIDERVAGEERLRRFVADASHELRTPITTIRGYAELYRHGGLSVGDQLDDAMRRTEQEAVRMGRLVEDMLLLAKLDQDRPLARDEVDLAALLADAAADARAVDAERPIGVDAPADADLVTVVGDEDRLRQVVVNLVGNALVHTPPGTPVELRTRRDDEAVLVEVADEGPGMPPEIVGKALERFYRADPARARDQGGSGLGLSIVDAVIRAHGGTIEIDSTLGQGTVVRFSLPSTCHLGSDPK